MHKGASASACLMTFTNKLRLGLGLMCRGIACSYMRFSNACRPTATAAAGNGPCRQSGSKFIRCGTGHSVVLASVHCGQVEA